MSLLSDVTIEGLCHGYDPLITPNVSNSSGSPSYGPSSYGYDFRLGHRFGVYKASDVPLDPKEVTDDDIEWVQIEDGGLYIIPAHGHCLAHTEEYVRIPRGVTGFVNDKSTYARVMVANQNTVLEAGWEGQITLEITNHLPRPVILRPGQGIVQVVFMNGDRSCRVSYGDRDGKYQGQLGVTLPR